MRRPGTTTGSVASSSSSAYNKSVVRPGDGRQNNKRRNHHLALLRRFGYLGALAVLYGWSTNVLSSFVFSKSGASQAASSSSTTFAPGCWMNPPWGISSSHHHPRSDAASELAASPPVKACTGPRGSFNASSSATALTCPGPTPTLSSLPLIDASRKKAASATIVLIYYANPAMLLKQLEHYYRDVFHGLAGLAESVRLVIVDDGSPMGLSASEYVTARHYRQLPMLHLVRIHQNIPWNQPGARNLGMHISQLLQEQQQSSGDDTNHLVISLDLDLILPVSVLQEALTTWKTTLLTTMWVAHAFNRSRPDGSFKIHPSALAISPQHWWSGAGGMEEDFAGHYGSEDSAFWWKWEELGKRIRQVHGDAILQQVDLEDPCDPTWLGDGKARTVCIKARQALSSFSRSTNLNLVKLQKLQRSGCWSNTFLRFQWSFVDRPESKTSR